MLQEDECEKLISILNVVKIMGFLNVIMLHQFYFNIIDVVEVFIFYFDYARTFLPNIFPRKA